MLSPPFTILTYKLLKKYKEIECIRTGFIRMRNPRTNKKSAKKWLAVNWLCWLCDCQGRLRRNVLFQDIRFYIGCVIGYLLVNYEMMVCLINIKMVCTSIYGTAILFFIYLFLCIALFSFTSMFLCFMHTNLLWRWQKLI